MNALPDFHCNGDCQCFPLKLYEKTDQNTSKDLLSEDTGNEEYHVRDGITDAALAYFQSKYPGNIISKDDLFYYIYGLLHSPEYRGKHRNNLTKQLPRLPAVADIENFTAYTEAGYKLAELHLNYESIDPWPVTLNDGTPLPQDIPPGKLYRVEKMKFDGKGSDKNKSRIVYNNHITISNIPLDAYDYVVNGKPAIQWVMERQRVKTDKASGIVNDANCYAQETMNNPAYPLTLLQQVVRVSMETMDIVRGLPGLRV